MKKLILLFCFLLTCGFLMSQECLLTKKIVYTVRFTDDVIASSLSKDSVQYNYIVNKRFFWEANDEILTRVKAKKAYFQSFKGDTIQYDTIINRLCRALNSHYNKKYDKNNIKEVLDNDIRAVRFWEEWTYNTNNMLINKKIIGYCPIIQRDSVALIDDELKAKNEFEFELGWIFHKSSSNNKDTILISNNLQYTMNIYNKAPYQWWNSNLEAEYSIPYFDMLIDKAENLQIPVFEEPNAVEVLTKPIIIKRRERSSTIEIYGVTKQNVEVTQDTIIITKMNSEDIEAIRFGEKIIFDKESLTYSKQVNYLSPIIYIFGSDGQYHGTYPIYYIRKER